MKTSYRFVDKFERYKSGEMKAIELFKFEIALLINPEFKALFKEYEILWKLLELHHRTNLINKLNKLNTRIMNDPENKLLSNQIRNLFP